jgi:hypothetical protein
MAQNLQQLQRNQTLEDAWRLFATYDHNSNLTRNRFRWIRGVILVLGIVATSLAILYQLYFSEGQTIRLFEILSLNHMIRFLVVLLPISLSAILTISSKFERGVNWILLRGSADALKQEIFRFRSHTDIYSEENIQDESREIKLARKIKSINERLMKTEVNQSGLQAYQGSLPPPTHLASKQDDGFSFLTPPQYIQFRLENQMKWYQKQTTQLDRSIRRLHYQIILFGALGTLLAAFEFEIWIAVTTAIVGAITSYIEYNQYEKMLTAYNMAATGLESIRIWWRSLPEDEKHTQETYEKLVSHTESVLEDEAQKWIHAIEDSLEKLDREARKSPGGIPFSSLPPIPEDAGLPPVDLTPADIVAGNWRGSQLPDRTPAPFDPRTHDDFPTSPLDWDSLSPEDFPDSPKPPISDSPRPEDLHTSPLDWDSLSPEDLPDAPKLSPDVIEELDRLFASDKEKEIHLSEKMYTDEVPELSPEEIEELDEFFASDQVNDAQFIEVTDTEEITSEDSPDEEPPVEDSFLPFGNLELSDEDVIVDDFVPGETTDKDSNQADKGEES